MIAPQRNCCQHSQQLLMTRHWDHTGRSRLTHVQNQNLDKFLKAHPLTQSTLPFVYVHDNSLHKSAWPDMFALRQNKTTRACTATCMLTCNMHGACKMLSQRCKCIRGAIPRPMPTIESFLCKGDAPGVMCRHLYCGHGQDDDRDAILRKAILTCYPDGAKA